jgi:hypothetical protein
MVEPEAGQRLMMRHHQYPLGEVRSQAMAWVMKDLVREQSMLQTRMQQPCNEKPVRGHQHCQRQVLQRG